MHTETARVSFSFLRRAKRKRLTRRKNARPRLRRLFEACNCRRETRRKPVCHADTVSSSRTFLCVSLHESVVVASPLSAQRAASPNSGPRKFRSVFRFRDCPLPLDKTKKRPNRLPPDFNPRSALRSSRFRSRNSHSGDSLAGTKNSQFLCRKKLARPAPDSSARTLLEERVQSE
ncbi:hypothetical protein TGP89_363260 [Toxoplasma gondii p89]|uniref:Uncharacterized protein n=1 Tax=Toxoplasma gondii p89 TaxID=943119 RepID=A0A086JN92_TOXGO|nr:hypothetical protein TGP89_363260 [Toxoplasma gondii p89]